jgi:hypothetical protein
MAANEKQGRYLTLFWTALTVLAAGIAYLAEGFGKLVLILGLAGVVVALVGFLRIKPMEGKTPGVRANPALTLMGIAVAVGGWFVTMAGLVITSSVSGRIVFALVGIAVSLIGVIGVLPIAFGRRVTAKADTLSSSLKTTVEHSR